ncbi:MAG: hypothetical protein WCI85_02350 [Comamonadaceae bacterium]
MTINNTPTILMLTAYLSKVWQRNQARRFITRQISLVMEKRSVSPKWGIPLSSLLCNSHNNTRYHNYNHMAAHPVSVIFLQNRYAAQALTRAKPE